MANPQGQTQDMLKDEQSNPAAGRGNTPRSNDPARAEKQGSDIVIGDGDSHKGATPVDAEDVEMQTA